VSGHVADAWRALRALHLARVSWWNWRAAWAEWRLVRFERRMIGVSIVVDGVPRTVVSYGRDSKVATVTPEWSCTPGSGDTFTLRERTPRERAS
jgi:hypothetical protein